MNGLYAHPPPPPTWTLACQLGHDYRPPYFEVKKHKKNVLEVNWMVISGLYPFLTHFCSQKGPFSRHFGIFHEPKRVTKGTRRAKNTYFGIASGLGTTLEKRIFSPQGPRWIHRWPQPCAGRATLRLQQVTTGTVV